ncbi:MAG: hypothetical protein LBD02_07145 [Christensenellaceae bacterium]|nr:hypothetical protein [Christensenellaceae bacterium]
MQRQWENPRAIEMEFLGLRALHIEFSEGYDHIILDAALFQRDELIYWADCDGWLPEDGTLPGGVWIAVKAPRRRPLEGLDWGGVRKRPPKAGKEPAQATKAGAPPKSARFCAPRQGLGCRESPAPAAP